MNIWLFLWLMVFLKIPIVGLFMIVRWAVGSTPEIEPGQDGGIGPRTRPPHPHRPNRRLPRSPRRGPHGDPAPSSPARVRTVASGRRLTRG